MEPEQAGKIVKWNDAKGFGFVTPDDGGRDVFIHVSHFPDGPRRPVEGDRVSFRIDPTQKRPKAASAELKGLVAPQWSRPAVGVLWVGIGVFMAHAVGLIVLPLAVLAYLAISLITCAFFWVDKRRAEAGMWRINESTFHTLEILGGWPGALVAQQALRHKTQKQSYQKRFWVITGVHLAVWLCWALGAWS